MWRSSKSGDAGFMWQEKSEEAKQKSRVVFLGTRAGRQVEFESHKKCWTEEKGRTHALHALPARNTFNICQSRSCICATITRGE